MSSPKLAAVIVTYYPTPDMLERLAGYAAFLDHVVMVDNTDLPAPDVASVRSGVTFLPMGGNRGLGDALNAGVEHAAALGFGSVVLLDQDSILTAGAAAAAGAAMTGDVGIVALRQAVKRDAPHGRPGTTESSSQHGCVDVPVTMTSGSILNVQAYRACGPFDSKLFIDYVDHDYCLRLRQRGYRIVQCMHASLDHELGEPKTVYVGGRPISFITHRPFRSYYIVRNGLYVATRYFFYDPRTAFGVIKVLCKELAKAVALENDRRSRLRYMGLGVWHWLTYHYGKTAFP